MPELFPDQGFDQAVRPDTDAGMVYYPTLLIGLGGSGAEVLLRVKRLLAERGGNGANSLHRFLFLDTDRKTFNRKPGFPAIEVGERCLIGVEGVDSLLRYEKTHPHIWKRFPKNRLQGSFIQNLKQGIGAGQVRSLGALAFAVDYMNIRQRLENAFNELTRLSDRQELRLARPGAVIGDQVAIYLVGSLCGGTGSGCFLDAALLARDVCAGRRPKVVGFFLLPCAAYDEAVAGDRLQQERIRANAYAALKELQFVLDTGAPERPHPVSYDYGNGNVLTLEPDDQLFALVYLVSDTNACGRLTNLDELFELTARAIFQDVGSPFGTNARSFESNNQVLTGVATCPVTNRTRLLGSFATSALVYPAERVARYCTYRALKELLYDRVLGRAADTVTVDGLVTAFLQQNRLDDRGSNDQIVDSLLFDHGRREVISSASMGLLPSFGANLKPKEFVEQLRQKWREFETTDLPQVRKQVDDNLASRLGRNQSPPGDPLGEAVKAFALVVAAEHNLTTACRAMEALESVVSQMKDELTNELNQWFSRNRNAVEQDFHQRCEELSRVGWLKALGSTDERLKSLLVRLFNDRLDAELRAAAKPKAVELLEVLANRVHQVGALCNSVASDMAALAREAETQSQQLETHAVQVSSRFAVEIEITRRGYETRYYSQNIETSDLFAKLIERHGDRRGFFAWLLTVPSADRVRTVGQALGDVIYGQVAPPLKATNIVDFVTDEGNKEEISDALEAKLDLLFELCQPFWDAQAVQSGQVFPEFLGVNVAFKPGDQGDWAPPPLVSQWIAKHGPQATQGRYQIIPSDAPYEVVLGRRSYGARAFYLRAATGWQKKYQAAWSEANGKYMLETHEAFARIPDLFPGERRAWELFALGLALGFIVRRGDWYYFGLERRSDEIHVLYSSQEKVAHTLAPESSCGRLVFKLAKPKTLPQKLQLGQGRQNAKAELRDNPAYMDLIAEAFDAYQQAVGNDSLIKQLERYVSEVLEPLIGARPELEEEKNAILQRIDRIGR